MHFPLFSLKASQLPAGTTCRARLKEDEDIDNWHNCVVVKTISNDEDDEKIVVKFVDFGT